MNKLFNLQLFAEEDDVIKSSDLEPAISIDFTSRLNANISELQNLLGVTEMTPMTTGTIIKLYKMVQTETPDQVDEGETIGLTKFERKLAKQVELKLNKYRKSTTAEAIQRSGRALAVNKTDEKLLSGVQKDIKKSFYGLLEEATGSATGTNLQNTLSAVWGAIKRFYVDEDATPIYFVSSDDVADYLGNAQITLQTAFGISYIEDFLGLGTLVVTPELDAGEVYGTAKENINGAYVPASSGDVAQTFGLTADATGLIGMTHLIKGDNATLETLAFSGVIFFPELTDGVIKGTIDHTPVLDTLTVNSVAGSKTGDTKITVTQELEKGHNYKYKTDPTTAPEVKYMQNVRNWNAWDGKSDITATTGHKITIVECDSAYKALKSGTADVTSK
uniref:hypothetical protein n=1 Tax=Thomasclavelia spiroformis TaxID=29348 RepID=UPI00359C25C2